MTPSPQPPAWPPVPAPAAPPPANRIRLPSHTVWLTYVLLGLILIVFLAQSASDFFWGNDYILYYGAKINELIAQGEWWRLLTPIFIHANLTHIAFNAYSLYNLGREIEAFYGWLRFSIIFFLAGLSGSVASLIFNTHPSVGASGAIFGLIGAEAAFLYLNRGILGERGRRAFQNVIVIVGINLFIGLQGGIDNWAHLGGLAGGLALAWFISPRWAVPAVTMLGVPVTLEDEQSLTGARWLAVPLLLFALAGLTALGIALQR